MTNWIERWQQAKRHVPDALLFLKHDDGTFRTYGDDADIVRRECQNWLDLTPAQDVIVPAWPFDKVCETLLERGYRVKVAEPKVEANTSEEINSG